MSLSKFQRRRRVKAKIRKNLSGTASKPRFTVFRSSKHIYVQLIDDTEGKTLVSASSREKEIVTAETKGKIVVAELVGSLVAKKAVSAGINAVAFDRGGFNYHGRIKALADSARKGGLNF